MNSFTIIKTFISQRIPELLRISRSWLINFFSRKNFNKIVAQLFNTNQSDELKALSAAVGVFIGIIPLWGFQTLLVIFLSMALKLNKALVLICSQVSFPPLVPVVLLLSYRVGQYWTGSKDSINAFSFKNINEHLEQYLYGSITLAVLGAITAGALTYAGLKSAKLVRQFRLDAPARRGTMEKAL